MDSPGTIEQLADAALSGPRVLAVGGLTKPRLSGVDAKMISMAEFSGIVEYDPSEFTFTARAGTRIGEITETLAEKGQYLPFDPMLIGAGSTLGGTVASGLGGPGALRFGGIRDFILGVTFVDGSGRILHLGGKVVKNSAGFDLPKFFTGSLGRFGILAEITMKVFPRPTGTRTLKLVAGSIPEALSLTAKVVAGRWEVHALDIAPGDTNLSVRLNAPEEALDALTADILAEFEGMALDGDVSASFWAGLGEFSWAQEGAILARIPVVPDKIPSLLDALPASRVHISIGGNALHLASSSADLLSTSLSDLGLAGLTLRGDAPLWLGTKPRHDVENRVKNALDPDGRYPGLDD